jgi:hypothetical protein
MQYISGRHSLVSFCEKVQEAAEEAVRALCVLAPTAGCGLLQGVLWSAPAPAPAPVPVGVFDDVSDAASGASGGGRGGATGTSGASGASGCGNGAVPSTKALAIQYAPIVVEAVTSIAAMQFTPSSNDNSSSGCKSSTSSGFAAWSVPYHDALLLRYHKDKSLLGRIHTILLPASAAAFTATAVPGGEGGGGVRAGVRTGAVGVSSHTRVRSIVPSPSSKTNHVIDGTWQQKLKLWSMV